MKPLWTATEAALATGGRTRGDWAATGIEIDSRAVRPGDLFVAIVGPNNDGHDYVAAALKAGAAAAMVHRIPDKLKKKADKTPLLVVEDTQKGLEALGVAARRRTGARIVGITGSCGKTGTRAALTHCLQAAGVKVHASEKSYNNHWGVPLSMARMPAETEVGVLEMGMNHPGEIRALTRLATPDVAVITTVEAAHLAAFRSVDEIADAKAEIFEGLPKDGTAILPADNPCIARLTAAAQKARVANLITFGQSDDADYAAHHLSLQPDRSCFDADLGGTDAAICVGVPGRHWVNNSLAVLAAVRAVGADIGRAVPALRDFHALDGRGARRTIEMKNGQNFLLIDESYNANPASMRAALEVLGTSRPDGRGRRIAILGDMLELGRRSGELHVQLADALADAHVELALLCGPEMQGLAKALRSRIDAVLHRPTSSELIPEAVHRVRDGDVVLVKGSLGSRMAPIVEALAHLNTGATPAKTS